MNKSLIEAYRRFRAERPDARAKTCLHWARGSLTRRIVNHREGDEFVAFDWITDINFRVKIEGDDDTNLWDETFDGVRSDWLRSDGDDDWLIKGGHRGDWYSLQEWERSRCLCIEIKPAVARNAAEYWRGEGCSKQECDVRGRAAVAGIVKRWRKVARGDLSAVGVVVKGEIHPDPDNEAVEFTAEDSLWGIEFEWGDKECEAYLLDVINEVIDNVKDNIVAQLDRVEAEYAGL